MAEQPQWAPEPWSTDTSDSHYLVTDAQGETIAQIVWNAPGNGRANAERIAACVNACREVPTKLLEAVSYNTRLQQIGDLLAVCEQLRGFVAAYGRQRHLSEYPDQCAHCQMLATAAEIIGSARGDGQNG